MMTPYTGKSEYCYANSLHMSLIGAGADARELSDPGFLECLTTLPFGKEYMRLEDGPLVFFSSPDVSPVTGLRRAIEALGWTCNEWCGQDGSQDGEEALSRLREGLKSGPVLVGPIHFGYLSYVPGCPYAPEGDHFVVVLAVKDEEVILHDPGGYPFAVIPISDFLLAWRAEHIPYKRGPYIMRTGFRKVDNPSRRQMMGRTLPLFKDNVAADPGGPEIFGGIQALRLLAQDLRGEVPAGLQGHMVNFAIPLAARRCLDAAAFLLEAGKEVAGANMRRQAELFGRAQYLAANEWWVDVAGIIEQLAEAESELVAVL